MADLQDKGSRPAAPSPGLDLPAPPARGKTDPAEDATAFAAAPLHPDPQPGTPLRVAAPDLSEAPTGPLILAPVPDSDAARYPTEPLGPPPPCPNAAEHPPEPRGGPPLPPAPTPSMSRHPTALLGPAPAVMQAPGGSFALGSLATDRLEGAADLAPVLYRCPLDGETLELLVDARWRPACRAGHPMQRLQPPEASDPP